MAVSMLLSAAWAPVSVLRSIPLVALALTPSDAELTFMADIETLMASAEVPLIPTWKVSVAVLLSRRFVPLKDAVLEMRSSSDWSWLTSVTM